MIIYALYRNNVSTAVCMDWLSESQEYSMRIAEDDEWIYSSLDQPAELRTYEANIAVLKSLCIRLPSLYLHSWKNMGCKGYGAVVRS